MAKPRVHLWVYNHPVRAMISEQISFFVGSLQQHGYPVSIGRRPHISALNVVIENFSPSTRKVLADFCRTHRKRVAVIMTEHLDFDGERIFFHGVPLGADSDYIPAPTAIGRVTSLLECLPHLRCVFVLGDLPELRNLTALVPNIDVRAIPFPRIRDRTRPAAGDEQSKWDFVFTGGLTAHRTRVLGQLEAAGFSLLCPKGPLSRRARDAANRAAKVVLNIPQWESWRWLSLMRILAGLETGRPTVSLGTRDASRIAACCTQLSLRERDWPRSLRGLVEESEALWARHTEGYAGMVESFERERGFPHDVFEFWRVTDGIAD